MRTDLYWTATGNRPVSSPLRAGENRAPLADGDEQRPVEQCIAHATVVALHKAVLRRLSLPDIMPPPAVVHQRQHGKGIGTRQRHTSKPSSAWHDRYRMPVRSGPATAHARRPPIFNVACRGAWAFPNQLLLQRMPPWKHGARPAHQQGVVRPKPASLGVGANTARPGKAGGGAGGIRTLDTLLTYTHFPGERLRPLGHRSAFARTGCLERRAAGRNLQRRGIARRDAVMSHRRRC